MMRNAFASNSALSSDTLDEIGVTCGGKCYGSEMMKVRFLDTIDGNIIVIYNVDGFEVILMSEASFSKGQYALTIIRNNSIFHYCADGIIFRST